MCFIVFCNAVLGCFISFHWLLMFFFNHVPLFCECFVDVLHHFSLIFIDFLDIFGVFSLCLDVFNWLLIVFHFVQCVSLFFMDFHCLFHCFSYIFMGFWMCLIHFHWLLELFFTCFIVFPMCCKCVSLFFIDFQLFFAFFIFHCFSNVLGCAYIIICFIFMFARCFQFNSRAITFFQNSVMLITKNYSNHFHVVVIWCFLYHPN